MPIIDISEGKEANAILTDIHKLHIDEHSTVLDSPEVRSNPHITGQVLAHIQQHLNILQSPDPKVQQILQLLGQQPLPQPNQPPQGGPPPGGPAPQPHAPGPAGPQMVNPTPPVMQEAQGVKGPRMPTLPKGAPAGAGDAYAQLQSNAQM